MLARLTRIGLRKGLVQGSRPWLAVGVVAVGVRLVRRLTRWEAKVVFSEELGPGQALVIKHAGAAPEVVVD